MAGIYHEYTASASNQVLLGYQCSKCGKRQLFRQTIDGSATTDDRGVFLESTLEKRKNQAREKAAEDLMSNTQKFKIQIRQKKYRCLKNVPPCTNCGHEEPWASVGKGTIGTLMALMFLAALIAFVVWVFAKACNGNFKIYWPLGFAAAAFLLYVIHNYICGRQEAHIVKSTPIECLPVVLNNQVQALTFLTGDGSLPSQK